MGCREGLPEQVSPEMLEEEGFLKAFHHALLEVRPRLAAVLAGQLASWARLGCSQSRRWLVMLTAGDAGSCS
jgi:hypothetical protein